MRRTTTILAFLSLWFGSAALAQQQPGTDKNCPLLGVMPDYLADSPPQWENWDTRVLRVDDGNGGDTEISPEGAVCSQGFGEKEGKTEGSTLEIIENYKDALRKLGAEIKHTADGYVAGHLVKDGKEVWLRVTSSRDDSYAIAEVFVEPFKRSLLPPSGNDYRLVGHMPGYTPGTPDKKNFDQYSFPTTGDDAKIRGRLYIVDYEEPSKKPARPVTMKEILENYRQALHDLNAEMLRDAGPDAENLSARLDDHGQMVYLFIQPTRVTAVEEKPFQVSIQPPTADVMRETLDKQGHIALYVNFDFAKATLKPDAVPVIAQIVDLMKRNPDLKVSIEGHTDAIGGHDYNMKLSADRAASVVAAVVASGIDGARLTSAGYGPDKPIATNDTDEGRAKNRRVELVKAP